MHAHRGASLAKEAAAEELSSVEKYELEWIELCTDLSQCEHLLKLRERAIEGDLKVSKFRSICWALLLRAFQYDPVNWLLQRREARLAYRELKTQFNHNPYQGNLSSNDDPLSQSNESVWNQHFCDQELSKLIRQDVQRTFPGIDFFRKASIQEIMTNILFCYARSNPLICYRQGMHELLAPLIFIIHSDHRVLSHVQDLVKSVNHTLEELLDPEFLEEDSYALFVKLMEKMEKYYKISGIVPDPSGHLPSVSSTSSRASKDNAVGEIEKYVKSLQNNILARHDIQLQDHMAKLDVPLSILAIRWFRVLYGREFSFMDILILWDAIFASGSDLELIPYVAATILISVRDVVLTADYSTVINTLMKYPNPVDISLIVKYSLHMMRPEKYLRPSGVFVYVPPRYIKQISLDSPRSMTLPKNNALFASRPRRESERQRTSSLSRIHTSHYLQNLAVMNVMTDTNLDYHDSEVVEGYLVNDPTVMRLELLHAYSIMNITKSKLLRYLTVLKQHAPGHGAHEYYRVMDGIEELCDLLASRHSASTSVRQPPVEPALEANETGHGRPLDAPHPPNTLPLARRRKPKMPERSDSARNLRRTDIDHSFEVVPVEEPLTYRGDQSHWTTDSDGEVTSGSYEKPNTILSRKMAKIIGDRKSLEMKIMQRHGGASGSNDRTEDQVIAQKIVPHPEKMKYPSSEQ
ncbi:TBC1 domain family member 5 [Phlebotomus argentipes]|uniref:TBC1 domain family member 5 n=1 Tax=Phlebotomus argentipes TaxID=94469 RepID=UPI0028934986|nr:TBC1 domain family member 5 [Phlebotomus argentipes]